MMSYNKPAELDYRSVLNYMKNRAPLREDEATWIKHKDDMVTLRPGREHAWLDDIIEGLLKLCHCSLIEVSGSDYDKSVKLLTPEQAIFCSEVLFLAASISVKPRCIELIRHLN
jgi:hypothetical protein